MATRKDARITSCDRGRLERLLDGTLPAGERAEAEAHLETCPACQVSFDAAAAGEGFWAEASSFLRDDELDAETTEFGLSGDSVAGSAFVDRPELHRVTEYFLPTDDPRMLGRFGGYEVAGVVGSGGMGVVLKGYEPALDRYVAIKLLAPHLAASGAARARFAREARAAAAVLHENVVAIHAVAEANGLPYLVMPYLAGESLQKRLDERGPLSALEALRIGTQVAAGLAAAHAQGLVHRDVKPGNVLLDKGVERVVLTDFGLARAADDAGLTRSGVIAGTPQYMSPEQARGEPVDHRSDLFSLGSLLYAMLAGRPPFRAETAFGVLRRITDAEPRPLRELNPEAPDWLCHIVSRLHAKHPRDRFGTAGEVAGLLGAGVAHLQNPRLVPPPATGRAARAERRRSPWLASPRAAVIAAGLLGMAFLATVFFNRSAPLTEIGFKSAPVASRKPDAAGGGESEATAEKWLGAARGAWQNVTGGKGAGSEGGRWLGTASGTPVIYVADAQGGDPARLARFGEFTGQGSADWSADGSRIAFDAYRPGLGDGQSDSHILTVAADGADPRDLGVGALPSWSPDAGQLAFSTYKPRAVWVMNADGSGRRLLDGSGWSGRWSPDGRTIAYTVQRGGRGDLCLHDVATDRKRYVFDGGSPYETIYWSFCWSPDSRKLCFLGARAGGTREIVTVAVDGPKAHHHVHRRGSASAAFAWHPAGRRILMAAEPPAAQVKRLFTFAADGSAGPEPLPGLPDDFAATPGDWSPDGSRLVFTGFPTGR